MSFVDKARRAVASLWKKSNPMPPPARSTNRIDDGARQSRADVESRPPSSRQSSQIDRLLHRDDGDARRVDLDRIDREARATNTWGSSEHRRARDQREREHSARRRDYEALSDDELDQSLGTDEPG